VLANSVYEPFVLVGLEAMAAGVPVVATCTGSLSELVVPGAGYLVPQRDPVALAGAIEALAQDRDLRRTVGERGRARVLEAFDTTATTAALRALIAGSPASRRAPVDDVATAVGH